MAHQAFRQVVKKVVSASSAVIATTADDCKDDMDEIAHLVFGAALPTQGTNATTPTSAATGTITPTKHHSICEGPIVPITCTTPPAGHPIQVHSNPTTNAAIVSLGRRMAANSAIQRGVMETISQSGWLVYGSGGMFIPLEDSDSDPGLPAPALVQGEMSDDDQPGIPLSDDEDWEEDFGVDAGVVCEEEALARSFPHMSIVGPAPRPLPNSNSVPLLSSMASASASHHHDQSPEFSPTISPTPSRTSSIASTTSSMDSEVKAHAIPSPPTTTTSTSTSTAIPPCTSTRTPSLEERRRARANAKRKSPGIIPSFVSWIRSFFVDVPSPPSTSTSTVTEEKHGVVQPADASTREEKQEGAVTSRVAHDAATEGVPSASTYTSSSTSTSTSTPKPASWWSTHSTIITAAIGVATVILVLLVTKRVNPSVFARVVAYLRR